MKSTARIFSKTSSNLIESDGASPLSTPTLNIQLSRINEFISPPPITFRLTPTRGCCKTKLKLNWTLVTFRQLDAIFPWFLFFALHYFVYHVLWCIFLRASFKRVNHLPPDSRTPKNSAKRNKCSPKVIDEDDDTQVGTPSEARKLVNLNWETAINQWRWESSCANFAPYLSERELLCNVPQRMKISFSNK